MISSLPNHIQNKIFYFIGNKHGIDWDDLLWIKETKLQFRDQYCNICGELEGRRRCRTLPITGIVCYNCFQSNFINIL